MPYAHPKFTRPAVTRRFGYVIEKEDRTWDFKISKAICTPDILSELDDYTKEIFYLQPLAHAHEISCRNFAKILVIVSEINPVLNHQKTTLDKIFPAAAEMLINAMVGVSNFLSSASAFLSLSETQLKKIFGSDSRICTDWNELRRARHRSSFAYRFLYELRNFSQHYGLPISDISLNGERSHKDQHLLFETNITLSRDELLNNGYDWKKLKPELASLSPDISLLPLLNAYKHELDRLAFAIFEIFDAKLQCSADYIGTLARTLNAPESSVLAVFLFDDGSKNAMPKSMEQIPSNQLTYLRSKRRALKTALFGARSI